jgi:dienelactone hydrolase
MKLTKAPLLAIFAIRSVSLAVAQELKPVHDLRSGPITPLVERNNSMKTSRKQPISWKYQVVAALTLLLLTGLPSRSRAQVRREMRPFESMTLTGDAFLRGEPGKPVVLAGELRIPRPGSDKLPAVILMHTSSGITVHLDRWAQELNNIGVAVFLLDSASGRGIVNFTTDPANLSYLQLIVDAFRALNMLAQHPRIDRDRIAVMGFSMGALPAVYSSNERFWKLYGSADIQFAAHIGVYGSCNTVFRGDDKVTGKPIRMFKGTLDDFGLIEPCREYVSRLKQASADVSAGRISRRLSLLRLVQFEGACKVSAGTFAAQLFVGGRRTRTVARCQNW